MSLPPLSIELPRTLTELSDLPSDVSDLPSGVSDLPSGVSDLHREVSELPSEVAGLSGDVSVLPSGVSDLPCDISGLFTGVVMSDPPLGIEVSVSVSSDSDSQRWNEINNSSKFVKYFDELSVQDFQALDIGTKMKIAYLLGSSVNEELKNVAKKLTSKQSRGVEKLMLPDEIILKNVLKSEVVHQFFEGATQKKPRSDDEDCSNYAGLHITAFESLLKCVNSKAIGLGALKKKIPISL